MSRFPATVAVLGVRHHGPGSARSVGHALAEFEPDLVLVEGPAELDALVAYVPRLVLPVAALVHVPSEPRRAAFYPFASFSPEWVALEYAHGAGVPAAFADLDAKFRLADHRGVAATDPIGVLAATAGYDDPERWWEDAVESKRSGLAAFELVLDAMRAVRDDEAPDPHTAVREAAMRKRLRSAARAGHRRIAFVCGAFHAPAVHPDAFPSQASDAALLKGLDKVKVSATWVPWTTPRLALASGYGAGVTSPGWYQHLFDSDADPVSTWLVGVARALRAVGLVTSPAAVVEATRLATTLAVVRGRPQAGLDEVTDAAQSVLCEGSAFRLHSVLGPLLVGDVVGVVPDDVPKVPIAGDLEREARRLRMKRTASVTMVELDLRKPAHLAKSVLLHRLQILGIDWGEPADTGATLGSFKEAWALEWRPELSVQLVEASVLGGTVEDAAHAAVVEQATSLGEVDGLARLLDRTVPAELPAATRAVLAAISRGAARQHDTTRLMDALEPLARVQRYGTVRGVDRQLVADVVTELLIRVTAGLVPACQGGDDDVADAMVRRLDAVQRAVSLLDDARSTQRWLDSLAAVADRAGVAALLAGRSVRLLLDAGALDRVAVATRTSRVLSRAAEPTYGAAWIEGFLRGEAIILLHDDTLLDIIDEWLVGVPSGVFDDLLPLLRRTFAVFAAPDRRAIGERLTGRATDGGALPADLDEVIDAIAPRIRHLLGAP